MAQNMSGVCRGCRQPMEGQRWYCSVGCKWSNRKATDPTKDPHWEFGQFPTCPQCGEVRYPWPDVNGMCDKCHERRARPFRHGLTVGGAEDLLDRQGGSCFGCEGKLVIEGDGTTANVDHDHTCCPVTSCGRCVRGLLCRPCNMALGFVRDSPETLLRLASYISNGQYPGGPKRA